MYDNNAEIGPDVNYAAILVLLIWRGKRANLQVSFVLCLGLWVSSDNNTDSCQLCGGVSQRPGVEQLIVD